MKITVDRDVLKADINVALEDYEKEYAKLMTLYNTKIKEYAVYVDKFVTEKRSGILDYPPSRPSYLRDTFVQAQQALHAHKLPTVVMDDGEYNSILSGIQRLRQDVTCNTATLNAVSYT